ncbi:MAG: hypothetical protein GY827_09570 [Cytophagales bacterium]|nr:hypothetical protein [Cytophagales bacterium]
MGVYVYSGRTIDAWYFQEGHHKKLDKIPVPLPKDPVYISETAIGLRRYDATKKVQNYWVDFDTSFHEIGGVQLKIVDSLGHIQRFFWANLDPVYSQKIDYQQVKLIQTKRGGVTVLIDGESYNLRHSGFYNGNHHLHQIVPYKLQNTNKSFYIQESPHGGGDYLQWLVHKGKRSVGHSFYRYGEDGSLLDSHFVYFSPPIDSIGNFYLDYDDYSSDYLLNDGKRHAVKNTLLGAYGRDEKIEGIFSILHTFNPNGIFYNFRNQIFDGLPIEEFNSFRNKEVLKKVHATCQAVGYPNILSDSLFSLIQYNIHKDRIASYQPNLSLKNIADSLIYYFPKKNASKYYQKFWKRRKEEGIDTLTYEILQDILSSYQGKKVTKTQVGYGVLGQCMKYDLALRQTNRENQTTILLNYYQYLYDNNLKQSAYGLVFLAEETQDISINRDSIFQTLNISDRVYLRDNKKNVLTKDTPIWINENESTYNYY